MPDGYQPQALERVPTGITGLDTILHGGVFRGGVYIVIGIPGAGKTILAHQIAFHHLAVGGRVAYVSVLTETHSRLFAYMRELAFFSLDPIGETIHYLNAYQTFREAQLGGLLEFLRTSARDCAATLLIIDGVPLTVGGTGSDPLTDDFIHDLQAYSEMARCTTLMLTPATPDGCYSHALTMVDGHVELINEPYGDAPGRKLVVRKFRGSRYLHGYHPFEITERGIVVNPSAEHRDDEHPPGSTP